MTDRPILAEATGLELISRPVAILDPASGALWWANSATLHWCGVADRQALLEEQVEGVAASWLQWCQSLVGSGPASGELLRRQWQCPQAAVVNWLLKAITLADGREAWLLEGSDSDQEDSDFRQLIDHIPQGIVIHYQGVPLFANRAFAAILGYESSAALPVGMSVASLYPIDEITGEGGLPDTDGDELHEATLRRPDGHTITVRQTLHRIHWQGKYCQQISLIDISAYKKALADLRESSLLLAKAESIAKLGSWQLDVENLRLSWSREAFRIFGMDPDRPVPSFEEHSAQVHPDDREMWRKTFAEAMRGGRDFEIQFRNLLPDGTARFLEARGQCVLDERGRSRSLSGTVQDITERKRMERIKDEFVSTVSHELRTPLTSIRGSLGLVTGGAAGELPPKATNFLRIAYKNCERLVNLVNDILDMAKIESGSMEYRFRPLDLLGLIEQSMEANRPFAQQFEVSLAFEDHLPEAVVFGDNDRLMQVMANLLANATKFSPQGGQVTISLLRHKGMLRVSVADQGPGIPEDFQGRVFDKFAQVDSSDIRQKSGTGLGLAIVQAIVKKHWGFITFETEVDKGTVFHFDLPEYHQRKSSPRSSNRAALVEEVVAATEETDGSLRRLLVCEDDEQTAELLKSMLEPEGFSIDVVHTAEDALIRVSQTKYVAMTIDLLLPDQDGISLIRSVRSHPQGHTLPIIVVSLKADEGKRELNGEALGIIDWLSKPIDNRRLLKAISQAMRHLPERQARILHVEDDTDVLKVVAAVLGDAALVDTATSLQEAQDKLRERGYDLVIIDIGLPDGSGLTLLEMIKSCSPRPPVLVFSAQDCDSHMAQEITTVLVKARTTNRQLCNTIKDLITH